MVLILIDMISFKKVEQHIIANYSSDRELDWLREKFDDDEEVTLRKTFTFSKEDIYQDPELIDEDPEQDFPGMESDEVEFILATLNDEYYKVKRGVLTDKFEVHIHKSVKLSTKLFYYGVDISIFNLIEKVVKEDIWIGGNAQEAINEEEFLSLIKLFPTDHEKRLYLKSRVSSVLQNYFTTAIDGQQKLQNYVDKQLSKQAQALPSDIYQNELHKLLTIRDKLNGMLNDTVKFSELRWQKEILEIILLLYPKYINVFKSVTIDAEGAKRQLDFMLVDANGNLDIVEIKKPSEETIMSRGVYRNNYIPFRELSGTIMQLEKYIYFLNRWGLKGERKLTERYQEYLPEGLSIKIVNPSGLIIMGREKGLTPEQKQDFEVVKRKYKNVVDILTYDCLINRLSITIEQMKKGIANTLDSTE